MGQQWLEVDLAHLDDYDSHLMKLLQVRLSHLLVNLVSHQL
jgi:hypothetical protein